LTELEGELQALGSAALVQCRSSQVDAEGYVRAQHGFVLKGDGANLDRLKQVIQRHYNRLYHGSQLATGLAMRGTPKCWAASLRWLCRPRDPCSLIGNSTTFVRSLLNSASSAGEFQPSRDTMMLALI
jgi:hypothetical protein